jgi:hypothetical protein
MHKKWFWSAVWVVILTATLEGQSRESILKAVADSGWIPAGSASDYDETNIDALAGPRASIVNAYGLAGATSQVWRNPALDADGADGAGSVTVILYQMVDSSAAYGWYTIDRDAGRPGVVSLPVGSEAFRQSNHSRFWQSNYVVELEGSARATESLARLISENILGRSQRAPVSNLLPPNNLVAGTQKYLLTAEGLDLTLRLDGSKFGFEDSAEVATARYEVNGRSANLVLVLYPTQQIAKKYADQWETDNPGTAFRKRRGPLFALVHGSSDPALAQAILDPVNYESQVTWNERRPDISLGQVIVTIFTFIGVALVFTLVAGVSFGGLRIFVKARYPNRVFDRAQDTEIIQLKLAQGVTRKELRE